ncbi:MAG: alpha/beta fold hydrolase [Candidatus Coproplasma sp.]
MQEIYYPSSDGKNNVHACIWAAEGECRAVLQIIHGMAEYAARYAPIGERLAKLGITVCAEDHLGHGKTAKDKDDMGYFAQQKGYAPVLSDIASLTEIMRAKYQGVPYFVMGHSMGSFFCRKYISVFGKELAGAIIMGTGYMSGALTGTAKLATRTVAAFKGWRHRSKLINNLAFGSYNKRFEGRTEYDWLSANEENVDRYIADELCGVPFTCNAFYGLFSIITEACKTSTIKATPSELPILLVSGKDDPVGGYGKGVIKLYDKLCKYGKNVSMTLYDGFRHEILNDDCAVLVEEDIEEFISSLIG